VLTIGFVKKTDANILKKPQGPGSPLPNADLLREAIYQHTGHRVRFTISELEPHEVNTSQLSAGSAWPVVSRPGSDASDTSVAEGPSPQALAEDSLAKDSPAEESSADPSADPSVDSSVKSSVEQKASSSAAGSSGPPLATRGEPVLSVFECRRFVWTPSGNPW